MLKDILEFCYYYFILSSISIGSSIFHLNIFKVKCNDCLIYSISLLKLALNIYYECLPCLIGVPEKLWLTDR